jgi:hypothetical protein
MRLSGEGYEVMLQAAGGLTLAQVHVDLVQVAANTQ